MSDNRIMEKRLIARLAGVAGRLRLYRLGWGLVLVWCVAAVSGYLLLQGYRRGMLLPDDAPRWWLISALATALVVSLWIIFRNISLQRDGASYLARRLERRFPDLNQSLLTATQVRPQADGGYGYLQRSVIADALRHDREHHWKRMVSPAGIALAWLANVPAIVCMLLVGWNLWQAPRLVEANALATARARSTSATPLIQPGNVEIERGSSLIVTARFEREIPDEVFLVYGEAGTAREARLAMRPSLNDPIFAAYVYDVDTPLTYQVLYDNQASDTYSVEVFEYPALVRADAELVYPDFTGSAPRTILDTRRVTAAVGTELTWQLHLNKPVARAELVPDSGEPIVLESSDDDPALVQASLTLRESQQWQLHLMDSEGRSNQLETVFRANVLPNNSTKIQLVSAGDVRVSPLEEFDVQASVSDDFAIRAAGIGYRLGGGEIIEQAAEMASESATRQLKISEMIDFESLQAEPDQLLSYYVWAEDHDDEGTVRRVVSDMFFAEVRPLEEIFRQGQQPTEQQQQQQQQQGRDEQTEELLELQKQIVIGTWNVLREAKRDKLLGRSAPDLILLSESQESAQQLLEEKAAEQSVPGANEIIARAAEQMQLAVERLLATAESLSKDDLADALASEQAAYQELLRLQSREHEVVRSQQSQSSSRSQQNRSRQQQIDQLELDNQENRYEDQRLAQQEQAQEQNEMRQIISRLRELAARQEDLNEQLREMEAALQAAQTEEQQKELQRQLERLREQQQQMLQDSDELQERLENQSTEGMEQARQQVQQARDNLQQSSEALRQGDSSQALSAGTRAEQELKQAQEQVRQQAAGEFGESMQQMRQQAAELEQKQNEIVEQLNSSSAESGPGLRAAEKEEDAAEKLKQQQQRLAELLENMQETVEHAEEAEPLLAQKLYDSYRRAQQQRSLERLEVTEQLVERNLTPQARQLAGESSEDLSKLRSEIDEAAEAVLGSEVESLRLALDQLNNLSQELDQEIEEATGRRPPGADEGEDAGLPNSDAATPDLTLPQSGQEDADDGTRQANDAEQNAPQGADRSRDQETESTQQSSDASRNRSRSESQANQAGEQSGQEPGRQSESEQSEREQTESGQQEAQPGQDSAAQSSPQAGDQSSSGQPSPESSGEQSPSGEQPSQTGSGAGGNPSGPRQSPGLRGPGSRDDRSSQAAQSGQQQARGGNPNPITGDGFRQWSDRLREVEELVIDPELRWEATQIRQAAREIRGELQKHSPDPRWPEVEDLVATPLRELQRKVSQELIRRAAERTEIVPLDRDPVPSEFSRSVRIYYENLGSGR